MYDKLEKRCVWIVQAKDPSSLVHEPVYVSKTPPITFTPFGRIMMSHVSLRTSDLISLRISSFHLSVSSKIIACVYVWGISLAATTETLELIIILDNKNRSVEKSITEDRHYDDCVRYLRVQCSDKFVQYDMVIN
ncbi:hypothetical protein PsorP6_006061 [Peronosclerospora sorghi]|uniref:Uncharacterized protein n=1 Tax=Peronosclerospora sorghi TaxID=230839 RepID=A0ACC0W0R3_9STRA|nr:hypothetical protein PsorP6_006061 [Peronosclerospora sorghi]